MTKNKNLISIQSWNSPLTWQNGRIAFGGLRLGSADEQEQNYFNRLQPTTPEPITAMKISEIPVVEDSKEVAVLPSTPNGMPYYTLSRTEARQKRNHFM
jgi:hypothetical protein